MTGRQRGFCAGYDSPGWVNPEPGFRPRQGFRRRFGRGFGRRWFSPGAPQYNPPQEAGKQEIASLESESRQIEQEQASLRGELEAVKKRLRELQQKE
jgi:hypothetical protein